MDDASSDGTMGLVERYRRLDPRLVALRNSVDLQHGGALDRALAVARREFVAVPNADDTAMPKRLSRQAAYLDAHPGPAATS